MIASAWYAYSLYKSIQTKYNKAADHRWCYDAVFQGYRQSTSENSLKLQHLAVENLQPVQHWSEKETE